MFNYDRRDTRLDLACAFEHEHFVAPKRYYGSWDCGSHHRTAGFTS